MRRLSFLFWLPMVAWLAGSHSFAKEEIIINEIFYNAPGKEDLLQFVELYNRGQSEADISGWRFRKGIRFVFPETTRLAAGSYLVVCRNRAEFVKRYGAEVPAIGDFGGKLSHGGERVELADAHGAVSDVLRYSN